VGKNNKTYLRIKMEYEKDKGVFHMFSLKRKTWKHH
jgi:hypothetical protein